MRVCDKHCYWLAFQSSIAIVYFFSFFTVLLCFTFFIAQQFMLVSCVCRLTINEDDDDDVVVVNVDMESIVIVHYNIASARQSTGYVRLHKYMYTGLMWKLTMTVTRGNVPLCIIARKHFARKRSDSAHRSRLVWWGGGYEKGEGHPFPLVDTLVHCSDYSQFVLCSLMSPTTTLRLYVHFLTVTCRRRPVNRETPLIELRTITSNATQRCAVYDLYGPDDTHDMRLSCVHPLWSVDPSIWPFYFSTLSLWFRSAIAKIRTCRTVCAN